jgi:tetratricopeptide (TPR) repeat protein
VVVGRLEELAVLCAALKQTTAGHAGVIALTGEAGIGKTTLLRWAFRQATERAATVAAAHAAEYERELPLGVWVQALDDVVGRMDPRRLDRLGGDDRVELSALFPSLTNVDMRALCPAGERHRMHFAVRALLEELATDGPLVIGLDDMQWADTASIELLAHLLRRPPRGPVLLLVAYRHRYASPLLATAFEAACQDGRARILELAGLNRTELGELIGPSTEPGERAMIYRESGGNPFYAEQLVRHTVTSGEPATSSTRHAIPDVPPLVQVSLAQELAELSEPGRVLLRAAAVVGDPFDLDIAVAVAEVPAPAALQALDELAQRELVSPAADPRSYAFRHPIVRHAVYSSAGEGWRLGAHARAAELLVAAGAPATAAAPHVQHSARIGDRAALDLLRAAGDAASSRAPETAAHWYRAALRVMGDRAPAAPRIDLLVALSSALSAVGRLDESREHLAQAIDAVSLADPHLRTRLVVWLAGVEEFRGQPREGRRLLVTELDARQPPTEKDRAILTLELGVADWRSGEWDAAIRHGHSALRCAQRLGNDALAASAAVMIAICEYRRSLWAAGAGEVHLHLDLAQSLFDKVADEAIAAHLDGLSYLIQLGLLANRLTDVARNARRGVALARSSNRAYLMRVFEGALLQAQLRLGQVVEAERRADIQLEAALLSASEQIIAWGATHRAWTALERDDPR